MSRTKPKHKRRLPQPKDANAVEAAPKPLSSETLARAIIDPFSRHATLTLTMGAATLGRGGQGSTAETANVLRDKVDAVAGGDLTMASRMLAAQAVSLDTLFTDLALCSATNMGQYPDAMERYMRLALKAQSASRAALEALAKLHQPREQTIKHVHVNEGGQAVVADHIHQHRGGGDGANAKTDEQSHATG